MSTFPLLSLPPELQLIVLKNIDDVATLRRALSVPEVLTSVGPLIRYVTNFCAVTQSEDCRQNCRPYFQSLANSLTRIPLSELHISIDSFNKNERTGLLYIVDLDRNQTLTVQHLQALLNNKDLFITIKDVSSAYDRPFVREFLGMCYRLDACAVGFHSITRHIETHFDVDPQFLPWPKNLRIEGFPVIQVLLKWESTIEEHEASLEPIRCTQGPINIIVLHGSTIDIGEDDKIKACLLKYSELFHLAREVIICQQWAVGLSELFPLVVEGIHADQLTGQFSIHHCHAFKNSSMIGHTKADSYSLLEQPSSLTVNLVPRSTLNGMLAPIVENISAPGVHKVAFNAGRMFPTFKNVFIPDVHTLTIRCAGSSTKSASIDEEQSEELSRMIGYTSILKLDRFTAGILSKLRPGALDGLKQLWICNKLYPVRQGKLPDLFW